MLVIAGGIAAYKSLELIRRLREHDIAVRCILTKAGASFVTPLSIAALSGEKVFTDLFSLTDEAEMGHIRLSREADLVVVAPATADLMAKLVGGLADDLASTALLATDKPVLMAPAMNPMMWQHAATQRNVARLTADGIGMVGPRPGDMACGESGLGRMAEPEEILAAIQARLNPTRPLAGRRAVVTSGPTHEPIDPVRYIANRSSGKQGHAIARALAEAGADVVLVSGPTREPAPVGVDVIQIETAHNMMTAVYSVLPRDIVVCAAAVADWRPATEGQQKMKKEAGASPPAIMLTENPDILKSLAQPGPDRPPLVIGFAAETEDVAGNAARKLARKGCDWILANDVSSASGTFGGSNTSILLFRQGGEPEDWGRLTKEAAAARLVEEIARHFEASPASAA